MARFLSDEWIEEMDVAVRNAGSAGEVAAGARLAIGQIVTDAPGGPVSYTVHLEDGSARVQPGTTDADVTFTQDHATATAIFRGELAAQAAFIEGRLRVGGDLRALMDHAAAVVGLDRALEGFRAGTTFDST
jgi:predicted lipid carrier protein YhbT